MKNAIQPLVDVNGVLRFKENKIVSYLLEQGNIDMNHLATVPFDADDRQHFAQLIGYSFSGWSTLSYVSQEDYVSVQKVHETNVSSYQARIEYLENLINSLRENLREPISDLYDIHPDNLG